MKSPFLLALCGIVALGAGAVLAIVWGNRPPAAVHAIEARAAAELRTSDALAPPPPVAAAPTPVATIPPAAADPAPPPPTQAPVSEPVRAAPAPAPELAEDLASSDAEARGAAMLELRQRRQQSSMQWLNRRRGR